ncbi:MAG: hypothetical protein ACTH2K_09860 [Candidatus Corynebacterium faecigallinarum]
MGEKLTATERCAIRHHNPVLHGEFLDARTVILAHRLQNNVCRTCTDDPAGAPERVLEPPLTRVVRELERAETKVIGTRHWTAESASEKRRALAVIRVMLTLIRAELSIKKMINHTNRGGDAATGMEM